MWEILFDNEYESWFDQLDLNIRKPILAKLILLRQAGPQLGRPTVDTVEESDFPNMKELRVQVMGDPWRVLFAFDPTRRAILLVGGNKRGDKRWYKNNVPIADDRFRAHLASLKE